MDGTSNGILNQMNELIYEGKHHSHHRMQYRFEYWCHYKGKLCLRLPLQKGKEQGLHVAVWIWRLSLNLFLIDISLLGLKHCCVSGRWQAAASCFALHVLCGSYQNVFCYPLSLLLPCIYQCHCDLGDVVVMFGSQRREKTQHNLLLLSLERHSVRPTAVEVQDTCNKEQTPTFSGDETEMGENSIEAPNCSCRLFPSTHNYVDVSTN